MSKNNNSLVGDTGVYGMASHENRLLAVEEIHARPYLLIKPPRVLVQLAFMNEGNVALDRNTMVEMAERLGATVTDFNSPYHGLSWKDGDLHCEKYTEYSTYLWSAPFDLKAGSKNDDNPFKKDFSPPGPVLSGVRIDVLPWSEEAVKQIEEFNPISLCHSITEEGKAEIATDFRQDEDGLTHILILDRGLSPSRLGALAQSLLEIETSRTLALLGIPLSRSLIPNLRNFENRLYEITQEMRASTGRSSEELLSELTDLSAELEADTAATVSRFGASRTYYENLEERLANLRETFVPGANRWQSFIKRRIAPAMQTCRSVQERQNNLSQELARTISLLRSRIDVEIERQNNELLSSMNNRAKLQLQLQQTVEGLSVAAISYYVIGLLSHFIEGIPGLHDVISTPLAVTILVPAVVIAIWWTIRRIRLSHSENNHLQ